MLFFGQQDDFYLWQGLGRGSGNIEENGTARAVMLFTFQFLEQVHVDDLLLCPGKIIHQPSGREVPLALLAGFMDLSERTVTYSYTCPVNKQVLQRLLNQLREILPFVLHIELLFAFAQCNIKV